MILWEIKNAASDLQERRRLFLPVYCPHRGIAFGRHILRGHIKSQHEPVGALKLKRPVTLAIGFNLIGHHHEPVVARCAPVRYERFSPISRLSG